MMDRARMTKFEACWRGGLAFAAVLVMVNCGGQAIHSEHDPEADGGSGGSTNGGSTVGGSGGSGGTGFTNESVVSSQSAQVSSVSSSSGGGGGYGGSAGITGVGGVPGIGGGPSVATVTGSATSGGTMEWGDLPVPNTCVTTRTEYRDDEHCSLDVNCAGAPIAATCYIEGNTAACSCDGQFQGGSYVFIGLNVGNACPYTIAACLHAPPFEAEPYECLPGYDVQDGEACYSRAECERDAVMGEVELTESGLHITRCTAGTTGWDCSCHGPVYGVRFEIPSGTSMTPCLDARDWCGGEELELVGNRDCTQNELTAGPDSCAAWMDCKQAVLVSGVEATMYETVSLQCWRGPDGSYECSCLSLVSQGSFYVDAPASADACDAAVDICAGG